VQDLKMQPGNILKISSLDEQWHDKDEVMIHACFQLLVDVVEKENLFTGDIDWQHSEKEVSEKAEILELYNWWLEYRGQIDEETFQKDYEFENQMFIRLIKIRSRLWT
jgi:hypothetical protein